MFKKMSNKSALFPTGNDVKFVCFLLGFSFAPLKAHIGSVTVLKAREYNKANPVTPHAQLISYASDHIVLVWSISIGEVDDSNDHELEFVLHMHIEMRHEPVEMLFCGDVLVLRTRKLLYYHK